MNNWLGKNTAFELTPFDRLILYKIYLILERIDPVNAELHRLHRKIVRDGPVKQYYILLEELTAEYDQIPSHVSDFVEAVINMYLHMTKSYTALTQEEIDVLKEHPYFRFLGFNLAKESDYEEYAYFYLNEVHQLDNSMDLTVFRLPKRKPESLRVYQRMLDRYESRKIDTYLSFETLSQILK